MISRGVEISIAGGGADEKDETGRGVIPCYIYRKAPATISQVHAASLAASPATLLADVLPHSRPCWIWKDAPTHYAQTPRVTACDDVTNNLGKTGDNCYALDDYSIRCAVVC